MPVPFRFPRKISGSSVNFSMLLLQAPKKWCALCACFYPTVPAYWTFLKGRHEVPYHASSYCRKCDSYRVLSGKLPDRYPPRKKHTQPKDARQRAYECRRCKTFKWATEFVRGRLGKVCRVCRRTESADYRRRNPERARKSSRDWWARNRHLRCLHAAIRRAREAGACWERAAQFDVDGMYERQEGSCFYCGAYMRKENVTIEHILPISRGGAHEAANLALCCRPCNSSKNNKTLEEYKVWLKQVGKPPVVCDLG